MKKIMALMLSALLLLSSMSFAVCATQPEISEITAGAQSVSVIFAEDIETAENLGITLTTEDGVAVPYTTSIIGDTLTIIPTQEFARDTESYIVTINGVTKLISVKTLWTPTFVADTTNATVSGLKIANPNGERYAAVDVIDEDTVVMGGQTMIYPDYDEILNYVNASLVADVYYTENGAGALARFGFNTEYDATSYSNGQTRNMWTVNVTKSELHKRMLSNRNNSGNWVIRGYSADAINPTSVSAYTASLGTAPNKTETQVTAKGTVALPEGFYENAVKHRYVIDKSGAVGTLIMNGALIDICDIHAIYEADTTYTDDVAPTTGYLLITSYHTTSKIVVENMALVTTVVSDCKSGILELRSEGTLSGDKKSFDIEFADDITPVSDEVVKEYIKVTKSGEDVAYTYVMNENKITIKPENGLVANQKYDVVVFAGFGYDNYKVASDVILDYTYHKETVNLEVKEITAGAQSVSVIFTTDIEEADITEQDVSISLTTDDGALFPYTTSINGNTLTIVPKAEFARDIENYIVKINDVSKLISVKTLWTPTFVADTTNATVSGLKIANPNGERYAAVDVIDEDTVVMGGQTMIYPDYDEILNYVNASLVADVYYTENGAGALARFGFNTEYDATSYSNGQTRNMWTVNVTKSELHKRMLSNRNNSGNWVIRGYSADAINPTSVSAYTASLGTAPNKTETQVTAKGTVALPEGFYENAVKHRYVIDKSGAVGTLIMNGALIDVCDTQAIYDADTTSVTEDVAPTTGYLLITPYHTTSKIVVENMALITTEVKDIAEGGISLVDNTYSIDASGAISGTVKVRNFTGDNKNAAVVAVIKSKNGKFVDAVKVLDRQIPAGEIARETFNVNSDETEIDIEYFMYDAETEMPEIEVDSIIKADYDNDTIKVIGKVAKSQDTNGDGKQCVYVMLAKDGSFAEEWSETSKKNGDFRMIEIPADAEEVEYTFEYKSGENDVYPMTLYQVMWNDKIVTKELGTYNYAGKSAVDSYVNSLKSTKTTFNELIKYAQSMGIDLKYADTETKQNVLTETLYAERENIASKENVLALISTAKARAMILTEIKNEGLTAALVNNIIGKYKTEAKLDTTKYSVLSNAQKLAICTGFINADYEALGYEAFAEAFRIAVENPPVIGGGATGGGGGGGGGAVVKPNVTPVMGAASAGVQEVDKTDAVDAPVVSGNFSDLKDYSWAEESINYLAKKGVISGIGNNQFNPEGTVTREQLAKMIVLAFEKYNGDAKNTFADVSSDNWSATYIASAKAHGLIMGVSENEFAPLSAVTREDIAVILYRATLLAGKTYETKKENFTDFDDVSDYAKEAVAYMAGTGIINGFEDGSFNPKAPATRAQAAKLIYEALGKGK